MKSRVFLVVIFIFFLTPSMSFGYTATFTPSISVQGEYTDNVSLTDKSQFKEDEVITTVNPSFTGELVGKKGDAKILYAPSYAFYNRFDQYNGWRHNARFDGMYMIGKNTSFKVGDDFLYTENPLIDENVANIRTEQPTAPIDTTQRRTRRIYYRNYANAALNHQFGKYQSFRIGYAYNTLNNDDPQYEDKQNHNVSAGLTYWFGPKWGFDVGGRYRRSEFQVSRDVNQYQGSASLLKRFGKHFTGFIRYSHSVVSYDGESGNDTTYIPSVGLQYDIEKDISLIADAGYFYTDSNRRDNTSGATGDLRLIKLFEHGKLNLAVLGGSTYSFWGAENLGYNVYYEASASLTRQLAKHVNGNIFGSYRDSKYKDRSDREDKTTIVNLGITWQALEWMKVGLNYRFRSVNSTIDTNDYDDNRVYVMITLVPKVPFHTSRY